MGGYRGKESIVGEEHDREPSLDDVMSAGIKAEATGVFSQAKRWTPERLGTIALCIP
jgi:hypothetical protein